MECHEPVSTIFFTVYYWKTVHRTEKRFAPVNLANFFYKVSLLG
jgi:hypothetical protein